MFKRGMNVTVPGDRLAQEHFQYARNVRSYKLGEWRQRPGMSLLYPSLGIPIYQISRINNDIDGTFRRVVGANNGGTGEIHVDNALHTALNLVDSGYSPTQFSTVISRPDRSPLPYMFVGSAARNSKISPTGSRSEWGIAAPVAAPIVEPQGVNYRSLNSIADLSSTAGWTISTGSVSAPGAVLSIANFSAFLYDSGSTGMACYMTLLVAPIPILPEAGVVIKLTHASAGTETAMVQEYHQAVAPEIGTSGASIASIVYDSGSTGLCTMTLIGVNSGIERNSVLRLNHGGGTAEFVRILSVTSSLEGNMSVRCSTVNTHGSSEIVNGIQSNRIFTNLAHSSTTSVDQFSFSAAYSAVSGDVVTLSRSGISVNCTQAPISSGGSPTTRPLKSDDILNVSIQALFDTIEEIQIQFDVAATGFTPDYYYISIRQPDLIGATNLSTSSIAAQQLGFSRKNLDESIESSASTTSSPPPVGDLGDLPDSDFDNQYFGLPVPGDVTQKGNPITVTANVNQGRAIIKVPMSSLVRVGTGVGSLRDVSAIRIKVKYNNTSTSGFALYAFNISGSYEPNTFEAPNYSYVYRGRNTLTGARSNPSPAIRSPIESVRRRTLVTIPAHPDPQVDVIDVFRTGGTLTNYYLVGTLTNGATTLEDRTPDSVAIRNPQLEVDRFKPWVTSDVPKSGLCNVTGTSVTYVSGDAFNTGWVKGTQIIISDRVYTLYTNPSSTTRLELNESAGVGTNLAFQIPEPVLDGRTYPAVFGPFSGASGEFVFAVGDPRNPGFLYWTNGNDIESTSDLNFVELCPPSEELMNGVVLDGIAYCFSDKRAWRILPSFQGGQSGGGSDFYPQETAIGKGLVGRSAICVGDAIYFVSFDGIYRTRGDAIESLTSDSLTPLFDKDGTFITDFTVPVSPIDFGSPDDISLSYSFDGLYFTYKGRDTNYYTFYLSFMTGGWVLDSIGTGQILRSSRELRTQDADNVIVGTTGGKVMIRSNSVFRDDADAISCEIWDREEIWGDPRSTKQVGDTMIDIDPANATIGVTLRYENNTSNDVLSNITGNGRDQYVRDVNSGSGRIVRGVALDLTWSDGTSGTPRVYAWEPAALVKPEESVNRATDWDNGGYTGTKWLQGFRLRGDTIGLAKSFQVEVDGGILVESFNFTANGEQVITFWLTNPVVAHEFRIRGTDSDLWRNMGVEWIFEPEPERAAVWETQVTSLDLPFYSHIRELMVAHQSTTDITMIITIDGVNYSYQIPHGNGNRVRSYLPAQAIKGKYHKFRFESSQPFGLWLEDMEVRAGAWGRMESYMTQKPFGDISRQNGGARI
jgi:hypothetical protein